MNLIESIVRARNGGRAPVIAEIKRLIPKLAEEAGRPKDTRHASLLALFYEKGGACGISVVTEKEHFGGSPEEDIPAVLESSTLPILVKDFILDKAMVDYYFELVTRSGKDNPGRVTLLLTTHLVKDKMPEMLDYIHDRGMTALVETRTPGDLRYFGNRTPKIIGINNKNIDELEKGEDRIRLTAELIAEYRRLVGSAVIISQSAHKTPEDVKRSLEMGADVVLVGTAFMTAPDPGETVREFVHAMGQVR
jgi:indole-3-glycerol phosphate synthase